MNNVNKNIEYMLGKGVPFNRIRRVTGYLTGSLDRWNYGKKAEENDRVKHSLADRFKEAIL